MKAALLVILGLVVGGLLGFAGGAAIGFGGGAGIGVATGLSAGACGVAKAAEAEGFLTAEQIDRVFARAIAELRSLAPGAETPDETIVGAARDCDDALARLREAARH